MIWRYSRKSLQISPKSDTLIFFSKTAETVFLVFGLKLVLNMTFNLNESFISENFAIWRYLTSQSSKKLPKLRFLAIFSTLHYQFSLILHIIIGVHDVQLFSYNSPVRSMYFCFLCEKFREIQNSTDLAKLLTLIKTEFFQFFSKFCIYS